jgi:hypothetical protein
MARNAHQISSEGGTAGQDNEKMKREDRCGQVHFNLYGRSDKANAFDNQNADFQEGYAWGIETFAYHSKNVLDAEIEFRGEFKLTHNGFSEFKRGFWAARSRWLRLESRSADYQEIHFNDTFLSNHSRLLDNSCPDLPPAQPAGERDQLYARRVFGRNHPFGAMELRRIKEISYNNPRWGRIVFR